MTVAVASERRERDFTLSDTDQPAPKRVNLFLDTLTTLQSQAIARKNAIQRREARHFFVEVQTTRTIPVHLAGGERRDEPSRQELLADLARWSVEDADLDWDAAERVQEVGWDIAD